MTSSKDTELRVGGLPLWARFTVFMTLALAIVMAGAGLFLYDASSRIARNVQDKTLLDAVKITAESVHIDQESSRLQAERDMLVEIERKLPEYRQPEDEPQDIKQLRQTLLAEKRSRLRQIDDLRKNSYWRQVGSQATPLSEGVVRTQIEYGPDKNAGLLYRLEAEGQSSFDLLIPSQGQPAERGLLGLIVGTTILVILVGAGVSVFVANQVSGPIEEMVRDVRQISTGDLHHRTHVKGGGELALLARAIDRMTKNLAEAQETELELQIREREVEVATGVREALLPQTTPSIPGYDLGTEHISSAELGGDFHDFIEIAGDDRVGLLVCDVSGKGLPGALVGATARSYLRAELTAGRDVTESLQKINRQLAPDVRRGVFVTALYVLVDPASGQATVACAGHKIPLIRYTAADKKVRLIQPEGIALGFDKGPIFDRALKTVQVPIEPGDRLVLVNTGAVEIVNAEGAELGEKPLYSHLMRHAARGSTEFLERMRTVLESYSADAELPRDISLVTIARS